jgi:hypothetical protein
MVDKVAMDVTGPGLEKPQGVPWGRWLLHLLAAACLSPLIARNLARATGPIGLNEDTKEQ